MNLLRITSNAFVIWKKLHQALTVFKQASPFKLVVRFVLWFIQTKSQMMKLRSCLRRYVNKLRRIWITQEILRLQSFVNSVQLTMPNKIREPQGFFILHLILKGCILFENVRTFLSNCVILVD